MAMIQGPPAPGQQGGAPQMATIPSTFDNATKLLRVTGQKYVGAVTYGVGALGQQQPRTAHSFIPEFEAELTQKNGKDARLSVEAFAQELSGFFLRQWKSQGMPLNPPPGNDMVFLVGGYDENAPYGRVFEIFIPSHPAPVERHVNEFGMVWGGQREYTDRLITGFDPNLPGVAQQALSLTSQQRQTLEAQLKAKLQAPIPFQFLPLQDCVNLAILLIRTTISIQKFLVGIRGVGGSIDIATVTRTEGLRPIQLKKIIGEYNYTEVEEWL
ncbi:MAG: hypothetical protein L0Z62_35875 [Gemmataceae bacterium]|nr:hypothetical protein [Gemmataceae bacterium]